MVQRFPNAFAKPCGAPGTRGRRRQQLRVDLALLDDTLRALKLV